MHTTWDTAVQRLQTGATMIMDEPTFTSVSQFRAHYFPNMVEKEHKPDRIIVILPRPGV